MHAEYIRLQQAERRVKMLRQEEEIFIIFHASKMLGKMYLHA